MTIRRMRIAFWITRTTHTHTHTHTHYEYVIIIAFPLHHWLHERASVLGNTYIVYLNVSCGVRLNKLIRNTVCS